MNTDKEKKVEVDNKTGKKLTDHEAVEHEIDAAIVKGAKLVITEKDGVRIITSIINEE